MGSAGLVRFCVLALVTGASVVKAAEPLPVLMTNKWPIYQLKAEAVLPLNPPAKKRFDASALLRAEDGALLTIADSGPELFEIQLDASEGSLVPRADWFAADQLRPFANDKHGHFDCEGLAQDEKGRIYICEETGRWVFRCEAPGGKVERLPIDWSSITNLFSQDRNASWEGIAVGEDRLYLANERSEASIVVVDLDDLKVIEHFEVTPRQFSMTLTQYSDLCWFKNHLFILCRQQQVVLEVDPKTHNVLAEFNYAAAEEALGYTWILKVGLMEGLSVDEKFFWLLTDNNGLARGGSNGDKRPTLLRCPWPARK